jgi:hypothetical protein
MNRERFLVEDSEVIGISESREGSRKKKLVPKINCCPVDYGSMNSMFNYETHHI